MDGRVGTGNCSLAGWAGPGTGCPGRLWLSVSPGSVPAGAARGPCRSVARRHRALFVSRSRGTAAPGAVRLPFPWHGGTGRCSFPVPVARRHRALFVSRSRGTAAPGAGLIAGAAVAGVLLLARSFRLTTKFTNPLEIPVEFVEKNVKLRGKLHHITEKGLEVEHIPISIPFISAIQRKWQPEGLLLIRLAGVELATGGTAWLQRELLPKQPLWFQLLGRDSSALECLVLVHKGRFFSTCLNEELLSQGLARAARIEGLPHHSRLYWKLHKRLLQAELNAVKKNKGIWKEQTYSERVQERINSNKFLQRLKQFVSRVRSSTER
ncbi:protein C3orf33 homolog isoform X2 [Haemorhous mexicanus]|uniref:protein C3orf33 homolog isoform X2 n=1 Tax=Haemorhous mexicanus TaxID=30427 RepID=UPI0028BE5F6B|nr:protein C3orf33 homolog isoform X2 [Haemorhous mexicanus]